MSLALEARDETVDGVRVRVLHTAGSPAAIAPPVVVLHGWGASLEAMASITRGLEARLELLALDLPGFGQSDLPTKGWSVDDYADHVLGLCGQHGLERFSLLGHSFGARIAIAIASARPAVVGRMVLTGAAGIKPSRKPTYYGKVGVAKAGRFAGAVGGAAGQRLQDRMRRRVASQDWLDAPEAMRDTFRKVIAEDLSPRLSAVRSPTLLVWGKDDADTPLWMGKRMEAAIPNAGLVVLDGGHYVYAERAVEFNRIAEHFLTRAS